MSEKKTYPVVKKVSLAGLSEGWDESCFAYVVPSTYLDQREIAESKIGEKSPEEQMDYQLRFVRDRFVSGKIRVFDGEQFSEADMTADNTGASVELTDRLYAEIMGLGLDPKAIRKVVEENALQNSEVKATETTTSEESPKGLAVPTA